MSASTTGELFAWMEVEPDGREGMIAGAIPGGPIVTLCHRNRGTAESLRRIALAHGRATKHAVRLVRFVRAETLEESS